MCDSKTFDLQRDGESCIDPNYRRMKLKLPCMHTSALLGRMLYKFLSPAILFIVLFDQSSKINNALWSF